MLLPLSTRALDSVIKVATNDNCKRKRRISEKGDVLVLQNLH